MSSQKVPNPAVERDRQQAALVGSLRAPAAPHFHSLGGNCMAAVEYLVQLNAQGIDAFSKVAVNFLHNGYVLCCKSTTLGYLFVELEVFVLPEKQETVRLLIPPQYI